MKTFFDKLAHPSNLLTIQDYRVYAKALGLKNWQTAIKHCVGIKGGAFLMKANGSLVAYTKRGLKISQKTYQKENWGWEQKQTIIV